MQRFVATAVERASPRPMHGVPLPRPVRAGGGAQSRPIRAGRCPVERAPLAAQHCPAHGCGPQDDCQVQKKRLLLRRPCCHGARPKPSASGGSRCRRITANIVGFLPTSGKPTPRSCRAGSTGPKGEGQTRIVEAINCFLRQRGGVLVRRSCSFSQSLAMHTARIKIMIDNYNLTLQ